MPLTIEEYATYLDKQDHLSWPSPPDIDKPKAKPHLAELPKVQAVTWSVYGTLLAISQGELLFEHPQKFIMDIALDKTLQEFKMWGSMTRKPGQPAEYLGEMYHKVMEELQSLPSPGEKHPEIESEKIWEGVIKKLLQKDYQFNVGFYGSLNEFSRKVAYFFHTSLQGTSCYPGAADILQHLSDTAENQGIIENGQFFTLLQLKRGLLERNSQITLEEVLEPSMCVLSCDHRSRKPSQRLFQKTLEKLEHQGIGPHEVLHIGSSVARDIVPAKKLGMRTALFAGDKNSLDATPQQLKDSTSRPDILLTELEQIKKVLPG